MFEKIQNIIKEFAEKYNFVQEMDIEKIENSEFKWINYKNLDYKPFIILNIYPTATEIAVGKINIIIDTIDEEEWFSIEKDNYFIINIVNDENENLLMEKITNECKNCKLI